MDKDRKGLGDTKDSKEEVDEVEETDKTKETGETGKKEESRGMLIRDYIDKEDWDEWLTPEVLFNELFKYGVLVELKDEAKYLDKNLDDPAYLKLLKEIGKQLQKEWVDFKEEMSQLHKTTIFNAHEEIHFKKEAYQYIREEYLHLNGLRKGNLQRMSQSNVLDKLYNEYKNDPSSEGITREEVGYLLGEAYNDYTEKDWV